MSSTKFAARRLGLTELDFEDALTKEINDLLSEIDKERRAALDPSDQGSAPLCDSSRQPPSHDSSLTTERRTVHLPLAGEMNHNVLERKDLRADTSLPPLWIGLWADLK